MIEDQAKGLRAAILSTQKVSDSTQEETLRAKFICISSGKGGVGKSNFTANLAKELSDRGKKVVIIDADLGLANIEILFGVMAKSSFFDLINAELTIEDIITEITPNLSIISGGSGIIEMADIDDVKLSKVISSLSYIGSGYDYVLIDTGAGISNIVTSFASLASELIVIITSEPTSIADSYALIKTVANKDRQKKISLVINRVTGKKEAQDIFDNINAVSAKFIEKKLNYLGFIYEDSSVVKAVKRQRPLMETAPQSKVANCICSICDNIMSLEKQEQKQKNSGFIDRLKGIFRN